MLFLQSYALYLTPAYSFDLKSLDHEMVVPGGRPTMIDARSGKSISSHRTDTSRAETPAHYGRHTSFGLFDVRGRGA